MITKLMTVATVKLYMVLPDTMGATDLLGTLKGLLSWFFGAAGIGLAIVGIVTLAQGLGDDSRQRRTGILEILSGVFLASCVVLVNLLTAPPGT